MVLGFCFATILTLVLLWPFLGNTDWLRLDPFGFWVNRCATINTAPQSLLDLVAGKKLNAAYASEESIFGHPIQQMVTLVYDAIQSGTSASYRTLSVAVDKNGNPVLPQMPQSLITDLVLILCGGLLVRRFGGSPGKRLLGLRVIGPNPLPGVQRAGLKLLPFLVAVLLPLAMVLLGRQVFTEFAHVSPLSLWAGSATVLVFALSYYILPWARWRGATRYDRWLGLTVARV